MRVIIGLHPKVVLLERNGTMNVRSNNPAAFGERSAARAGACKSGARLVLGLGLVFFLATCVSDLELIPLEEFSCSKRRLDVASGMYDEAKEMLRIHFKERHNSSLVIAYYLSQDAEALSKSIRRCFDFSDISRERAISLIRANRIFRRVLVVNMRDTDPYVMISILGSQYDTVFKSDIH